MTPPNRAADRPRRRPATSLGIVLALLCSLLAAVVTGSGATLGVADASVVAPTSVTPLDVGRPSWWVGDCDATRWAPIAAAAGWKGVGSHRMGASYLGVPVCGPRPAVDHSPNVLWGRGGWGESEWQCVELAQRFMAQVYGTAAFGANGSGVVANYRTSYGGNLVKVTNGTVGQAPQPGDVVSFTTPRNIFGHVGVIATSTVDGNGDGSVAMLTQNDSLDGWRTLAVVGWRLQGFGTLTPYGWLHDPAGRGNPLGDGAFIHVTGRTGTWRIAGGAPVLVNSWATFGGVQPTTTIAPAQFARLKSFPQDGTYISDSLTKRIFRMAGGSPQAVSSADAARLPGWGTADVVAVDHYSFLNNDHLRPYPADRTLVCRVDNGYCYQIAGGAPLYVPKADMATLPGWSAKTVTQVSGLEFTTYGHLRPTPADGTFLCDATTKQCFRTAGGAPLGMSLADSPRVPGWNNASSITVAHWEFAHSSHLRPYPVDGTVVCPVGDVRCYVFAGRAPLPITPAAASAAPALSTTHATKVSPWEFAHRVHVLQRPLNGTALMAAQSKTLYVVQSGVARYVPSTTPADLATPPVLIDQNAVDNAGLAGPWAHLLSNPASVRMSSPDLALTTASTATLSWTAPVASSAVASYAIRYERAAATGAFAPWVTPKAWTTYKPTKVRIAIARGYDYCFQVRATNRAGQVGPWSPTRCTASALDDSAATSTSAGWRRSSSALLYAGTGMRTTTHGAWWKMTGVALDRIGVVATTCATCGSVSVWVNRVRVGVIDLSGPAVAYQQLVTFPRFAYTSGATVTIVVTSAAGRTVQLDGIAVSRT